MTIPLRFCGQDVRRPGTMSGPAPHVPRDRNSIGARSAGCPIMASSPPCVLFLFEGASRMRAARFSRRSIAKAHPGEDDRRVEVERNRFAFAPLVVGVISRAAPHPKIPEWNRFCRPGRAWHESDGGRRMHWALPSVWLTGWHAYDRSVAGADRRCGARKSRGIYPYRARRTIRARTVPRPLLAIS